jgi:hypothetical protein
LFGYLTPPLNLPLTSLPLPMLVRSGDVRLQGQVYVRDLIGDAATASKRAAESIDQMKAKMSGKTNM